MLKARTFLLMVVSAFVALVAVQPQPVSSASYQILATAAADIGTAFSYQGQLSDNGAPANGAYDFKFQFLGPDNNNVLQPVSIEFIVENVAVTNGLFMTKIDAGAGAFNGERRFLTVAVRKDGEDAFESLGGATEILPVPYALHAVQAGTLINPGPTVIQVSQFNMMQSDGQSDALFAARGSGRLEVTRAANVATEFLYIPVDVPSQVVGNAQKLQMLSFCYSGEKSDEFGVLAGIEEAGVHQMNKMSGSAVLFESYATPLTDTDACVNITADSPQAVSGSLWVRFKVTASPAALEFGEVKLTFVSE